MTLRTTLADRSSQVGQGRSRGGLSDWLGTPGIEPGSIFSTAAHAVPDSLGTLCGSAVVRRVITI